jgi:hypothetical protein
VAPLRSQQCHGQAHQQRLGDFEQDVGPVVEVSVEGRKILGGHAVPGQP